ncbi:MAG: hypothetical protein QNL33_14170 [Akkermansiaceae bacterium]|jgi:hypothetical protein
MPKGPKIGFDFYARCGAVPWDDLLSGKADHAPEMRLILKEEHHYQGDYSDDSQWQSFEGH